MKKIRLFKWSAQTPEGSTVEDNSINMIEMLLSSAPAQELPRGLEQYKLFARLSAAFEKAKTKDTLELEDADYNLMKGIIEKNIPAIWATNKDLSKAVESVLEAEEVK